MPLSRLEIRRLGEAAGQVTASGAFQRLEQAAANFRARNNADEDEVADFRSAMEVAFNRAVAVKFSELAF